MDGVKLTLNPKKIELNISGDRHARESLIQKFPTQLLGNSISPTNHVKNLCVSFVLGTLLHNQGLSCLLLSLQGPKTRPKIPWC